MTFAAPRPKVRMLFLWSQMSADTFNVKCAWRKTFNIKDGLIDCIVFCRHAKNQRAEEKQDQSPPIPEKSKDKSKEKKKAKGVLWFLYPLLAERSKSLTRKKKEVDEEQERRVAAAAASALDDLIGTTGTFTLLVSRSAARFERFWVSRWPAPLVSETFDANNSSVF